MRLLLCAVTVLSAVLATPATAQATTPRSALVLTVSDGTTIAPVRTARVLRCDPVGGDHPHAVEACDTLARTSGDFRAIPGDYRWCLAVYRPVTVTESGYWQGRQVGFRRTYGNECELHSRTASVFELD